MKTDDAAPGGFVSPGYRKLYRTAGLVLGLVFAAVGIMFLLLPGAVVLFFNGFARRLGMDESPLSGASLYPALAAAYMYVVTFLALGMHRRPEERMFALLLVHAKAASAVLSIMACFIGGVQLILVANAAVDGMIALGVAHLEYRGRTRTG